MKRRSAASVSYAALSTTQSPVSVDGDVGDVELTELERTQLDSVVANAEDVAGDDDDSEEGMA
jgi:hypothetical protein